MLKKGVLLRDPVSDLFTRIRNGYMAKHATVRHPHSRLAMAVVSVLIRQGYLGDIRVIPPESPRAAQFQTMEIDLKYDNRGQPAIRALRRVSKPSRRVFRRISDLPLASNGLGSWILSTPQGVLHCAEARRKHVGGEILGEVF